MLLAVYGFNQKKLVSMGLSLIHAVMLDWLLYFNNSGNQRMIHTDENGNNYYWVAYPKIIHDFPCLPFRNPRTLIKYFDDLCGKGKTNQNQYPLMKKVVKLKMGSMVGFAVRQEAIDYLKQGDNMQTIVPSEIIQSLNPKNKNEKRLNDHVLMILEKLLSMKINGKRIFTNTLPSDSYHYTKGIGSFQTKLLSLCYGNFLREHRLSNAFLEKNSQFIDHASKTILKSCKGDWFRIEKVLIDAAKHYASWWNENNEPFNKKWLPKNVSEWLYSERTEQSIFFACLLKDQFPLREREASNIFESIDPKVVRVAMKYKNDEWDNKTYWFKIKQVIKWYDKYKDEIIRKDANAHYWFGEGVKAWIESYFAYLCKLTSNNILLANVGTGNRTWNAFLCFAQREHAISLKLSIFA